MDKTLQEQGQLLAFAVMGNKFLSSIEGRNVKTFPASF